MTERRLDNDQVQKLIETGSPQERDLAIDLRNARVEAASLVAAAQAFKAERDSLLEAVASAKRLIACGDTAGAMSDDWCQGWLAARDRDLSILDDALPKESDEDA